MVQDSLQSKEAANLATPTVLNAQETSTTAQNVSQDSQLTQDQENVFLKQNAPTVKNSIKEPALLSAIQDSTSTKESVSMEDVSMDMLLTPSEDVSDHLPNPQDQTATSTNTSKTDNVSELARADSTLTQPPKIVWPALPTVSLVSVDPSALFVIPDMK